jgi:hypothetical protein
LNMRINNFVGAAWRAIQEGGFAVELSLLVGCGLKTHDVNPNGVWTSCKQALGHKRASCLLK